MTRRKMTKALQTTTAAILAGGLGTRLRSAVADRPKVLADVNGCPFICHLLDQLAAVGLRRVMLLTGFGAEKVRKTLGEDYDGLALTYADEPHSLGTAGALRAALPHLDGQTILLLNGDSFCQVDLAGFAEFHHRQSGVASLVLTRVEDCGRFGQVWVTATGQVTGFAEKVPSAGPGWVNAGIYLLDRTFVVEWPARCPLSLERDVLPACVDNQRCHGFRSNGPFLDIGTPESYAMAERFFQRLTPQDHAGRRQEQRHEWMRP